ncbi:MAG: TAT-variant-translocated molybdopterin oxidoreductase [Flavobacteriales bacterium]|nr:TAT-variant-translocated molybdopterin oxidoreductase [Flavobacteriales bacterium]
MSRTKIYWKGLDELHNTPEFQESAANEFTPEATADIFNDGNESTEAGTKRRDFLKFMGFSIGAATLAACETPVMRSVPYLNKPEDITPGVPNWYASSFFDGVDYASILVKTREGRPIKVIGNRRSTVTLGGVNARINSSVLSLYDAARAKGPLKGGAESTWNEVDRDIVIGLKKAASEGKQVVLLTETIISPSTKHAIAEFTEAFGDVKHVILDSLSVSGVLAANEESFGVRALADYQFDKAEVVVSFGSDFLSATPNSNANAARYAKMRKPKDGKMSRHFQFEANMSLTGSNADVRVAQKPSETIDSLVALYNRIASATGGSVVSGGVDSPEVSKAASELLAAKGKGIVISGSNSKAEQVLVNAINSQLGNIGTTIDLTNPLLLRQGNDADMAALVVDMNAGKVGALLIHGVNPSYSYFDAEKFNSGLAKVDITVSFADRLDETAEKVGILTPDHHYLESWNDAEPKAGHYSLVQPTIQPLFNTRQFQESLLKWSGNDSDYYTYIRENWKGSIYSASLNPVFANFFNTALFEGVYENGATEAVAIAFKGDVNAAAAALPKYSGDFELQLYVKAGAGDGSQANNPWLQELPDPVSRVTWDNYLTMSPTQMKELGFSRLERGDFMADVAILTANGVTLKIPVYPSPGQKYGTVGLAVGYGRTAAGKSGNGVGVNAFPLAKDGSFSVGGVTISSANEKYEIAQLQSHHTLMGRESIVKETTFAEYSKDAKAGNPRVEFYVASAPSAARKAAATAHGQEHGHDGHAHADDHGHENYKIGAADANLWGNHAIDSGHRWGMAIDLNKCIGCGACVTACGAENNVPVVGKEEVRRGRDMHWLRIDRYYTSDMTTERAKAEGVGAIDKFTAMEAAAVAPRVAYQPVMCQHCNHAPCETVCPVAATTHSDEGLNQMTYNRCIGTRYCANNCPYKVRRFNWFQYHDGSKEFGNNPANSELGRMVLNPDVVVRDRGVMEKCSFCVQGIQAAKLKAKKMGRKVLDEEVQSACAEACPTHAIAFGDLNDTESRVASKAKDERSYHLLEEVGVQPNVYYMTKVRNLTSEEV